MLITYKGKIDELTPVQRQQLENRYQRLGRLMDGRGEKEAHVMIDHERHLHHAEITVNYLSQGLVGQGWDPELFTALSHAVDKLEKQVVKVRAKRRDTMREGKDKFKESGAVGAIPPSGVPAPPLPHGELIDGHRIHRVDGIREQKPMTLEEALAEMDDQTPYFAYCDVASDQLAVLIRRPDGNLDLVQF